MAVLGTFGSFGIARLAIYASSSALNVTGNNIANINTDGYCRQYLSTSSMYISGTDQLASGGSLNFGHGVSPDAIYQYRDIYMDIRYRDESTKVGEEETKLGGLTDLAFILDEVAKGDADFGVIEAQFSKIVELLQSLSEKTGSEEYDTLVRSACETLVQLFNSYSDKLESVADNTLNEFVTNVNSTNLMLNNIRDLNEQIRNAEIYGDMALALRDQRNLAVDELSKMIGIEVVYSSEEIGMGVTVENMTIKIAGTNTELVNGIYATQLNLDEYVDMQNPGINDDGSAWFDAKDSSNYMYVDNKGNYTNYADQATAWLNPLYPGDNSGCAWLSAAGVPVSDARLAGPQPNPYYTNVDANGIPQANVSTGGALDTTWMGGQFAVGEWDDVAEDWKKNPDGSYYVAFTTNDPNFEGIVDGEEVGVIQLANNVEGDYDNAYLITLSPLMSAKGQYVKDEYNRDITSEVYLSDTVLSGALQAYRELLTEEGEYSSKLDIAMDSDATVKRGIPYYRMALDSLAQKFAETFNTINSVNPDDIFSVTDDGVFMDSSKLLVDADTGLVQLDSNGNPMYGPLEVMIDGVLTPLTTKNMLDENPATGNTYYEDYIFNQGVRDPNYMTDSTGRYLTETVKDGEIVYVPIVLNEAAVAGGAEPEYLTNENLTEANLDILEDEGIQQDEYHPEEMFKTNADGKLVDVNGSVLTYTYPADAPGGLGGTTVDLTPDVIMNAAAPYGALMFQHAMDKGSLTDEYSNLQKAGNLFSNNSNGNDASGITASTISISRDWSIGNVRIVTAKGENPGSTDNSNVLKFISSMDEKMQYEATDIAADAWTGKNEFFAGSFQGMLTNTVSILAQDMQTTTILLKNYETSALALDNYRISVSGVDLNEEATNMMQYQKSYVAASKLMTTLDEVLQVLLNM